MKTETALLRATRWQDISTAPRDGKHVWLFYPEARRGDDSGIVEGYWDEYDDEWFGPYSDGFACSLETCTNVKGEPSHWMPLPDPPA